MKISTTVRITAAALVGAASLAGTTQAKVDDSAASHYTARALKALGERMEAKANFYGKHSLSKQKKKAAPAQAQTPISTSPPECSFGEGECPAEVPGPSAPASSSGQAQAPSIPCAYNDEDGTGGC